MKKGFTLLELMIAVIIITLVILFCTGCSPAPEGNAFRVEGFTKDSLPVAFQTEEEFNQDKAHGGMISYTHPKFPSLLCKWKELEGEGFNSIPTKTQILFKATISQEQLDAIEKIYNEC